MLDAVLCPLLPREIDRAIDNLAVWGAQVPPCLGAGPQRALLYLFPAPPDPAHWARLEAAFAAAPALSQTFTPPEWLSADLAPEDDQYVAAARHSTSRHGFVSGPNLMFLHGFHALRRRGIRFYFLMETDCTPLRAGWLDMLDAVCRAHPHHWVLGSPYLGGAPLDATLRHHINGNALYQAGSDDFMRFLHRIYLPWLGRRIAGAEPGLAFDAGWDRFIEAATAPWAPAGLQRLGRLVMTRRAAIPQIVSIAGALERAAGTVDGRAALLTDYPQAVVAHGPVADDSAPGQVLLSDEGLDAAAHALDALSPVALPSGVAHAIPLGGAGGNGARFVIHPTAGFDGLALRGGAGRVSLTLRCDAKAKIALHDGAGRSIRRTWRPGWQALLPLRLSLKAAPGPVFLEVIKTYGAASVTVEITRMRRGGRRVLHAPPAPDAAPLYAQAYFDGPWHGLLDESPEQDHP